VRYRPRPGDDAVDDANSGGSVTLQGHRSPRVRSGWGSVWHPGEVSSAPQVEPSFPPEPWKVAAIPPEVADGDLAFTCPRCQGDVTEAAYGPCTSCRAALRAGLGGEARDIVEEDYIPKMNVTPNAVAVKD